LEFGFQKMWLRHAMRELAAELELAPGFARLSVAFALDGGEVSRLVYNDEGVGREMVEERRFGKEWRVDLPHGTAGLVRRGLSVKERVAVAFELLTLFAACAGDLHPLSQAP